MHIVKRLASTLGLILLTACGDGSQTRFGAASDVQGGRRSALAATDFSQASPAEQTAILLYQAFYGIPPDSSTFKSLVTQVSASSASVAAASLATAPALSGLSDAALAKRVLENLNVTTASVTQAGSYELLLSALTQMFAAYGPSARGQVVLNAATLLAGLGADPTWGAAASGYIGKISTNYASAIVSSQASNEPALQIINSSVNSIGAVVISF